MSIRLATIDDVGELVRVYLESSVDTYTRIASTGLTAHTTCERHERVRQRILRGLYEPGFTVVVEKDKEVLGFASASPDQTSTKGYEAELTSVYVVPSCQHKGFGRKLVAEIAWRFLDDGVKSMFVQTRLENDAVEFYKALGAAHLYDRNHKVGEKTLVLSVLGWRDISSLVEAP